MRARSVNRDLEGKARALAGLKGYVTNLQAPTAEYLMGAYHQLWQIEKSFRMSKTDLRARPIYHHKRDSIEAHLTIVFAALAVSRWLERRTDWSTKRLLTSLRRYHTVEIQAGRPDRSPPPTPCPTTSASSWTGSTGGNSALIDQSRGLSATGPTSTSARTVSRNSATVGSMTRSAGEVTPSRHNSRPNQPTYDQDQLPYTKDLSSSQASSSWVLSHHTPSG